MNPSRCRISRCHSDGQAHFSLTRSITFRTAYCYCINSLQAGSVSVHQCFAHDGGRQARDLPCAVHLHENPEHFPHDLDIIPALLTPSPVLPASVFCHIIQFIKFIYTFQHPVPSLFSLYD